MKNLQIQQLFGPAPPHPSRHVDRCRFFREKSDDDILEEKWNIKTSTNFQCPIVKEGVSMLAAPTLLPKLSELLPEDSSGWLEGALYSIR